MEAGTHSKDWRVQCGNSEHAIEQALRRLRRKASKKQMNTEQETLEVAKYVAVLTLAAIYQRLRFWNATDGAGKLSWY